MSSQGLCPTWSTNSSVSALGVFLGTSKPPSRALVLLHGTCRDVRRGFIDSYALQSPSAGTLITGSHKGPRLPGSLSAPKNAQSKLLLAINLGQLAVAAEELKRLQTDSIAVEPYTIEQLVEGTAAFAFAGYVPHPQDVVLMVVSTLIAATAALLKKQKFRAAIATFKSSQQSGPLQFHYFTYQSLVAAAIKVCSSASPLYATAVTLSTLQEQHAGLADLLTRCFLHSLSHLLTISRHLWTYTLLLQAGEPYTALEVFRQLQHAGLTPNFVTYSGLISALGKVRRRGQPSADLAYQLWQELYQLQTPLDAAAFRTGILGPSVHSAQPSIQRS